VAAAVGRLHDRRRRRHAARRDHLHSAIATTGGLVPPAEACNAATVGTENEGPYTAGHAFWKATGG
jgi:hypothetical protein